MIKKGCLDIVQEKCAGCRDCILSNSRKNVVFSDGNPETAKIMFIGEAPNELEDEAGKPFVGKVGEVFDKFLSEAGISRQNDTYMINIVKCRPPENRIPTEIEKALCHKYLTAQIDIMNPKAIVFCGATVLKAFKGEDKKIQMSKVRGQWFDIDINGKTYKAMAIFHPSYMLRSRSMEEGSPRRLMQQDLAEIKSVAVGDTSNPFIPELVMV
jgi:DNA polymerase